MLIPRAWVEANPKSSALNFRIKCVQRFNVILQERCLKHGFRYAEINRRITDPQGHVLPDFVSSDPTNVHISWEKTFPFWSEELRDCVDLTEFLVCDLEQSHLTYDNYKAVKRQERKEIEERKAKGEERPPPTGYKLRPVISSDGTWRLCYQPVEKPVAAEQVKGVDSDKTD